MTDTDLIEGRYNVTDVVEVRFIPEAWINDYAVEIDPDGPSTWQPTDLAKRLEHSGDIADSFRYEPWFDDDPACPDWIKRHRGPFRVEVSRSRSDT